MARNSACFRLLRRQIDSESIQKVSRAPKTSTGLAQAVCNSWDLRAAWPLLPFRVECFSEPLLRRLKRGVGGSGVANSAGRFLQIIRNKCSGETSSSPSAEEI